MLSPIAMSFGTDVRATVPAQNNGSRKATKMGPWSYRPPRRARARNRRGNFSSLLIRRPRLSGRAYQGGDEAAVQINEMLAHWFRNVMWPDQFALREAVRFAVRRSWSSPAA